MRPRWSFAKWREILGVSQWMLVRSIGMYLHGGLHRIVVGGRGDAAVLGGYTMANEISALPTTEVLSPLNRVLFPAFVKAKHDFGELKRLFLLAQAVQTLIAIPVSVGLALVASEAVPILLGAKWLFVVPFVQLLALASVMQAIATSGNYVMITLGRLRDVAFLTWSQVALFAVLVFAIVPGAEALQIAQLLLATKLFGLVVSIWLLRRALPAVRLRDLWGTSSRPLIAALVMAAVVVGTGRMLAQAPMSLLLIVEVAVGALVYAAAVLSLWALSGRPDGAESYLLKLLAKR